MKLNYRDRMILLGVIAVAIILIGIFALIRPKINDIKSDNAKLDEVKAQWSEIESKINEIEPLQKSIKDTYSDSIKICGNFVEKEKVDSTTKLDKMMQAYIDECNLEIQTLDLAEQSISQLNYYYYTPPVLTSTMFDAADVNGNFAAERALERAESTALSERTAESVIVARYGFTAKGNKEDIWSFMEKIDSLKTAVLIESVNIDDYTFGEDDPASDGRAVVTMIVDVYSVFEMDEPVVE